jgi:hypothetical protein
MPAAQYLLSCCRSIDMTRETMAALQVAIRVRTSAPSPYDQVGRLESMMTLTFRFTGSKLDRLKQMMQPGERIVTVLPREIETDRRIDYPR